MFQHEALLRWAYAANILILLPVCSAIFSGSSPAVFEHRIVSSRPLELLVGSYWAAILILSVVGILVPGVMAPLLALQILYKLAWLATFVVPAILSGRASAVPRGIALSFAAIVIAYPLLLWAAL